MEIKEPYLLPFEDFELYKFNWAKKDCFNFRELRGNENAEHTFDEKKNILKDYIKDLNLDDDRDDYYNEPFAARDRKVTKVFYSLQGTNDRIVPSFFFLDNGLRFDLLPMDGHTKGKVSEDERQVWDHFVDTAYSRTLRYASDTGGFYAICLTDDDIKKLPGYEEFSKTHISILEGRKVLGWNDIHAAKYTYADSQKISSGILYLKDGTRLTCMEEDTAGQYYEDDGRKYIFAINPFNTSFPLYRKLLCSKSEEYIIHDSVKAPSVSQIFCIQYMRDKNYFPNVLKRNDSGKYVIYAPADALTDKIRKALLNKGKPDTNGCFRFTLSRDAFIGELARHLEMGYLDGCIDIKSDERFQKPRRDKKDKMDFSLEREVMYTAAGVASYDVENDLLYVEGEYKEKGKLRKEKENAEINSILFETGDIDMTDENPFAAPRETDEEYEERMKREMEELEKEVQDNIRKYEENHKEEYCMERDCENLSVNS